MDPIDSLSMMILTKDNVLWKYNANSPDNRYVKIKENVVKLDYLETDDFITRYVYFTADGEVYQIGDSTKPATLARETRAERMGYKEKAKEQLTALQGQFSKMDEPLVWLRTAACSQSVWQGFLSRFESVVKRTDSAILSLGHGIAIFIDYQSDCFGEPYPPLLNQIKSKLASADRSFVSEAWEADWVVKISAAAREGNIFTMDGRSAYFSFVDATMEIVKAATAQSIYSNSWSKKGGDTGSYKKAALEAFNSLLQPLTEAIEKNIKE